MHSLINRHRNGNGKVSNLSQVVVISFGNTASVFAVCMCSYKILERLFNASSGDAAGRSYFFSGWL